MFGSAVGPWNRKRRRKENYWNYKYKSFIPIPFKQQVLCTVTNRMALLYRGSAKNIKLDDKLVSIEQSESEE
jgi:hypothetical protein